MTLHYARSRGRGGIHYLGFTDSGSEASSAPHRLVCTIHQLSHCCANRVLLLVEAISRMLKKSASFVLASFRPSPYHRGYASALHSLRPCWTAFLSILRECSPVVLHVHHRVLACQSSFPTVCQNFDSITDCSVLVAGRFPAILARSPTSRSAGPSKA